jgi:hypothetical protein
VEGTNYYDPWCSGEEKKMEAPVAKQTVVEKKEEIAPLMPTVQEYTPEINHEPVIFNQPFNTVETFNPVTSTLSASDEEAEQPIIFELSVDTPAAPEAPAAPVLNA